MAAKKSFFAAVNHGNFAMFLSKGKEFHVMLMGVATGYLQFI